MAKKEFKIGEVFQCGLIKLKCEGRHYGACANCYFRYKDDCSDVFDLVGSCYASDREDKTDVIFVKVEE